MPDEYKLSLTPSQSQPQQLQGTIGDSPALVREFIENSDIPDNIKQMFENFFWPMFTRAVKLSFLTKEDIEGLMNDFQIQSNLLRMSLNDSDWDDQTKALVNGIKTYYFISLCQSSGDPKSGMNLIKTMMASYQVNTVENAQSQQPTGLWPKIASMFRGH